MSPLLFRQTLPESLHQLVPPTERLDLSLEFVSLSAVDLIDTELGYGVSDHTSNRRSDQAIHVAILPCDVDIKHISRVE